MTEKIAYICDRQKCPRCSPECMHTTDIRHAYLFKLQDGTDDTWFEEPTIDVVVPVRHGKWITEEGMPGVAVCSNCGHEIRGIGCQYTKYCEECGARMDEVEK